MRFEQLALMFDELEKTTSRNRMMEIIARLLKEAKPREARIISYLLQGELAPSFKQVKFNIAEKLCGQAIAASLGIERENVVKEYKELGDLGLVVKKLKKKRRATLDLGDAYKRFLSIAGARGIGSQEEKIRLLSSLLKDATPLEAKYIVRIVLGRLRTGAGDYTFIDALSHAKTGTKELKAPLEMAYNISSDLGAVAEQFLSKGLKGIEKPVVSVFNPVRPALAERLPTAEKIVKKIGRCMIEPKYDGFRVQVHKSGNNVKIYSRNLEEMTHMFPEIVDGARKQVKAKEAIFEGEAIAYDENTGTFFPFQVTVKRKRKYKIEKMMGAFPLKLFVFDLLYKDGKNLMPLPCEKRKSALRTLIRKGKTIKVTEDKTTGDQKEIESIFNQYVSNGLEGILAKDLNAPYTAGARKFAWIKLKRSYRGKLADTVDVVVVGYLKGKGKRAALGIGALVGAVYNKKKDIFETIAKIGSGLTEEQTKDLFRMLGRITVRKKPPRVVSRLVPDVWVTPTYVLEINADEITRSPVHTCAIEKGAGLSLRFPRVVGFIRPDKKPEDATTTKEVLKMFKMGRKK